MRIRKRSGPLGFSSISISSTTTTTLLQSTDPPLSTRKHEEEEEEDKKRLHPSFGDQHQPSDQVHQTSSSDLELTFIRGKNGWVCCGDGDHREKNLCMMNTNDPTQEMEEKEKDKELKGLKEEEEEKMMREGFGIRSTTKNRKSNSTLGGEDEEVINSGVPPFSSNDHHQVLHERWCEGVLKGFPLKKRRGSCERKVLGGDEEIKQKKVMKTAANSNKKLWVLGEKDGQETEGVEDVLLESSSTGTCSAKKLVEGSRCSRINGRGWRCYQQALVGYSLCEHHSGKGRLRSTMNSTVRNRSSTTTITKPIKDEEEDDDEEKTSTTMRIENKMKRKKMGMVKARSISSLLGQTHAA